MNVEIYAEIIRLRVRVRQLNHGILVAMRLYNLQIRKVVFH